MTDSVTRNLQDSISPAIGDGQLSVSEIEEIREELSELAAAYDALKAENERLTELTARIHEFQGGVAVKVARYNAILPVFEEMREALQNYVSISSGSKADWQEVRLRCLEHANAIAPPIAQKLTKVHKE